MAPKVEDPGKPGELIRTVNRLAEELGEIVRGLGLTVAPREDLLKEAAERRLPDAVQGELRRRLDEIVAIKGELEALRKRKRTGGV